MLIQIKYPIAEDSGREALRPRLKTFATRSEEGFAGFAVGGGGDILGINSGFVVGIGFVDVPLVVNCGSEAGLSFDTGFVGVVVGQAGGVLGSASDFELRSHDRNSFALRAVYGGFVQVDFADGFYRPFLAANDDGEDA
jgi:hypothetical protein